MSLVVSRQHVESEQVSKQPTSNRSMQRRNRPITAWNRPVRHLLIDCQLGRLVQNRRRNLRRRST